MSDQNVETEWQFDVDDLERVRTWLESQPAHAPLRFSLRSFARRAPASLKYGGENIFFIPSPLAVPGMICVNPAAPT